MSNKLLQIHWFDKDIIKILDRYEIHGESAQQSLDRATNLAQAAFKTTAAMIVLADFQSFKVKSDQPLEVDVAEKLFDLAHLLKEVEPEYWFSFSDQPFFRESDLWTPIRDFRSFCCQPILNTDGIAIGWLCLFDKKQLMEDLHLMSTLKTMADMVMDELELKIQIKRSNRLQNDIIHLAAHDLKNPLSGIMSITDHIRKQIHDSEQLEEICDLIKDSSKRMMNILDDILKSGYLENGKIQLKVTPHRFSDLIDIVVSSNQSAAEKKKQVFKIEAQSDPMVLVDRHRMVEVLDNLVNNSVKYAPKNTEITIRIWEENGEVGFSIYNQGVGLSEEDKSKIFNKFSRLSARPTGGESSTGLGLSIVKMLIEMHGGQISAESEGLQSGVKFILQIPSLAYVES
jgi:signal transduction histidine kinase